jgi:hypothetical protein
MPQDEAPNRITDGLLQQDSNTRRFHLGSLPQAGIPSDLSDEEQEALRLHMAAIKVPQSRPRFGYDDDGAPIEIPAAGLVFNHVTGAVEPIKVDEDGVPIPPTKAEIKEQRDAQRDNAGPVATVHQRSVTGLTAPELRAVPERDRK